MHVLDWHAKLIYWSENDARLKDLKYEHIDALEELLSEHDAAQQPRVPDVLDANCPDCPFVADFRRCDECSKNPTRG